MLIGFGCSVPAIMATRTVSSDRDRKMTILLTPYMSCSAKIPIYGFFTAAFFTEHKALVMISLYVLGMAVGVLAALVMKNTAFKAIIGQWIAPIFAPLGFADWRCATALISGFVAKESVVSTLEVLLGGAAITSLFTVRSAVSFLVFTLLYTPCVAAVATIRRELGSGLKTVGVVVMQCAVAWLAAYAAFLIGGLLA